MLVVAVIAAGVLAGPFAECEKLLAAQPDGKAGPRCMYVAAVTGGHWEPAERRLRQILGRRPEAHWVRLHLGTLRFHQGDAAALDLWRQAAAGFAARADIEGEVTARELIAEFLRTRGRFAEAEAEVDRVAAAAAASGNPALVRNATLARAKHLYVTGGDLSRALALAREAEATLFPDGPYAKQLQCLIVLGGVAQDLGRFDEARRYHLRTVEVAERNGDAFSASSGRLSAAFDLMNATASAGEDHPRAQIRAEMEAALAAAERAGNQPTVVTAHMHLGDLLAPSPEAAAHFQRCLDLEGEDGDPQVLGGCRWGLALHRIDTEPAVALALMDRSLAQAQASGDRPAAALLMGQRALLRWRTGPRAEALADWDAALSELEEVRYLQPDEAVRGGVTSRASGHFHDLVGQLLSDPRADTASHARAFAVLERLRARLLLDALERAAAVPTGSGTRTGGGATAAVQAADRHSIGAGRADLVDVQAALAGDEALVSYQIAAEGPIAGSGGSWAIVVTRGGTHALPLPPRGEVEPIVPVFVGLLQRRDGAEARAAARLHGMLIDPVLARLPAGIRRLIVIPDGALHRLPFAALRDREDRALIERFELSVAPSATLWLRWRTGAPRAAGATALVLADPSLAPGGDLPALPGARREAGIILDRLGGGTALIAEQAGETALLRAGPGDFSVLHVAAHAVVDDVEPRRTAILLTPGGGGDGRLEMREIVQLPLADRIVVLAACRSAAGAELRGEGILGLARAFFQAGAVVVIGSLWPLRDDESAALFAAFYDHLARGESAVAALRGAQHDLVADGAPPAVWSGVVLLGDGSRAPFPGGIGRRESHHPWLVVLAIPVVLLATGWWLRARRRVARAS